MDGQQKGQYSSTKADAVCFSSGLTGLHFGAGVIHAYLAADRRPPEVVAGISSGALSAAALQRCYQELDSEKNPPSPRASQPLNADHVEAARWEWYRRYLSCLLTRPYDVFWNAIPDPSDFLADLPPVKDPALPKAANGSNDDTWVQRDVDARRAVHIMVMLGRWLSHLPLTVRFLAVLFVHYVRFKEGYPKSFLYRRVRTPMVLGVGICLLVFRLSLHTFRNPQWFPEWQFPATYDAKVADRRPSWLIRRVRPVLGWWVWIFAGLYCALVVGPWIGPAYRRAAPLLNLIPNEWLGAASQLFGIPLWFPPLDRGLLATVAWIKPYVSSASRMALPWAGWVSERLHLTWLVRLVEFLWNYGRWVSVLVFFSPLLLLGSRALAKAAHQLGKRVFWGTAYRMGAPRAAATGWRWLSEKSHSVRMGIGKVLKGAQNGLERVGRLRVASWIPLAAGHFAFRTKFSEARQLVGESLSRPSKLAGRGLGVLLDPVAKGLGVLGGLIGKGIRSELKRRLVQDLGIQKALLRDFHLRISLVRLFQDHNGRPSQLSNKPMPALLVAAPLEMPAQESGGRSLYPVQLWAQPDKITVAKALRACLATPGVFEPVVVKQNDRNGGAQGKLGVWDPQQRFTDARRLDLVDGAVVRQNPLPALFNFLGSQQATTTAENLQSSAPDKTPSVHLVYSTPILEKTAAPADLENPDSREPPLPNIIRSYFMGSQLALRRDSRTEVIRTNFLSELQQEIKSLRARGAGSASTPSVTPRRETFQIYVDEIAPAEDLQFSNPLHPTETELLKQVAAGCRQTLGLLYQREIGSAEFCPHFLPSLAKQRDFTAHRRLEGNAGSFLPGLSEVCRHCTKILQAPAQPPRTILPETFQDCKPAGRFPRLTGHDATVAEGGRSLQTDGMRPRIVFLTSGGVFRGSFHIGMLAALLRLNVKPDLIMGASVGTLMGAALGAMYSGPSYHEAMRLLGRLVALFSHVDEDVALTKTLKSASKDLGRRAQLIRLSPNELRKMVRRGSKEDPGLAATGAPPALIDAISDLFVIPYRETASIAAAFIAGEVSEAATAFGKAVEAKTLERMGIHDAIIGSSLLEPQIEALVGRPPTGDTQPFLAAADIAFFATAVNLTRELLTILGAEDHSFDFIRAALASAAFPAAFAPRRQSELYPGLGRRDIFYGDGGMYDNLPFFPAIEVLKAVQTDYIRRIREGDPEYWFQSLRHRSSKPDLFLVGALNARARPNPEEKYNTLPDISGRAGSLKENEKIYGFQKSSNRIDQQIEELIDLIQSSGGASKVHLPPASQKVLDGIVNAGVLPVFPTNVEHLNGTFEFCASLGLDKDRLARSIADGCFQAMYAFCQAQHASTDEAKSDPAYRSVKELRNAGKVPHIKFEPGHTQKAGYCPFFKSTADTENFFKQPEHQHSEAREFQCPFQTSASAVKPDREIADSCNLVYESCRDDLSHWTVPRITTRSDTATPKQKGVGAG